MIKRLFMAAMFLLLALSASPLMAQREGAGHGEGHAAAAVAVPHDTDWVYWLAISFLWLFIAAIVLGPIALWIRGPERPEVVSHAAAGHAAHH